VGNQKLASALIVMSAWMVASCESDASTPATVTLELTVVSFEPGEDPVPISGAEVCLLGTDDCGTTDADGFATVQIPANAESAVTVTADGFNPTISPQVAEGSRLAMREVTVLSEALIAVLAAALNTPYPPIDTGFVAVTALTDPPQADDNGILGVSYTLTDPQGQRYYLDENGFPDTDLTATTAPLGAGGFIELAPGVHKVELGGTANNCTLLAAWAGDSPTSIRVPVEDGFFTDAYVICDPVEAP
jgi:hypothetical protein